MTILMTEWDNLWYIVNAPYNRQKINGFVGLGSVMILEYTKFFLLNSNYG